MKKCMSGRVFLLHFILLLAHESFYSNGHELTNEELARRLRRHQYDQNVGTVLFDRNDITRECWSNDELLLLNSRIIFDEILPQAELMNVKNDKYIDVFLNYVDICLGVVHKITTGKTKRLVMKALADTLGGYLRVYILPLTKNSYYAGNIKYRKAKRIFDLYDDLKSFLRTNGVGWFIPTRSNHRFKVSPLLIPSYNRSRRSRTACAKLILYPDDDGGGGNLVPLPFLDDDKRPNSIALPYENISLRSLFSADSAFILLKYYTDGVNCMSMSSVNESRVNKFKSQLADWLCRVVKPLLDDENWYPAFGGVLRILASVESADVNSGIQPHYETHHSPLANNIDLGFASGSPLNKLINARFEFIELVIIGVSIIVLLYLLIGICVNWCIIRSRERRKIEAFKKTPIVEFYDRPRRFRYTRSARSAQLQIRSENDCFCSDEDDDEEKYLNELTYSSTSAVSPIKDKSLSVPKIPRGSSVKQPAYTSDETSAFSSPAAKEASS